MRRKLFRGFLKPETPVDKAWKEMSALLDREFPVTGGGIPKKGLLSGGSQTLITAVAAMAVVGGGAIIGYRVIENVHKTGIGEIQQIADTALVVEPIPAETAFISGSEEIEPETRLHDEIVTIETVTGAHQVKSATLLDDTIKIEPDPGTQTIQAGITSVDEIKSTKTKDIIENTDPVVTTSDETSEISIPELPTAEKTVIAEGPVTAKVSTRRTKRPGIIAKPNILQRRKRDEMIWPGDNKKPVPFFENNRIVMSVASNNKLMFGNSFHDNILSFGGEATVGIYNLKRKMTFETGIGFGQMEFRTIYNRSLYFQHGSVIDSTTTAFRYKFKRRAIDIPLWFSKELYRNKRFFFDLKTGINASLILSQEPLFQPLPFDFDEVVNSFSPPYFNLSLMLAPQISCQITDNLRLFASPQGTVFLNSFYRRQTAHPAGLSMSIGVKYRY